MRKKKDGLTILVLVLAVLVIIVGMLLVVTRLVLPAFQSHSRERIIERQLRLGKKYLSEMDYDKAVAAFSEVIQIDDKNTEAYVGLADAYTGLGEWTSSVQNYDHALLTVMNDLPQDGAAREEVEVLLGQMPEADEDYDIDFVMDVIERRDDALENGLMSLRSEGSGPEELVEWLGLVGHLTYQPEDPALIEMIGAVDETTQSGRSITGYIVDSATGAPLAEARVIYTDPNDPAMLFTVYTDNTGYYTISDVPAGSLTLQCYHDDYLETEIKIEIGAETAATNAGTVKLVKKPDYEGQLAVIERNRSQWDSLISINETPKSGFAVTDIDQNGRLEVIVSGCMGTGHFSMTFMYEVDETGNELKKCVFDSEETPDYIFYDSAVVYCVDNTYYAIFNNSAPSGWSDNYNFLNSVSLQDGELKVEMLGMSHTANSTDGSSQTTWYDRNDREISEEEYNAIPDQVYAGGKKGTMTLKWIELSSIGDNLQDQLRDSWEAFAILSAR